jgi:hypothetical protein
MASIVYLHSPDNIHEYGIEILTTDKYTAENFMFNQVIPLCCELKCNYFIQGQCLTDYGNNWVFIEFFGEGNGDKILSLLEKFNKLYGNTYYNNEVIMEEPSRKLLKQLGLM